MPVKGCCPECGFQGDLIAFVVDVEARQAIAEALRLAPQLEPLILRYLGLFRPESRTLALHKAVRLLKELADAIAAGKITRHGRSWAAPLSVWKESLETMLDARNRLTLPLKSHGYLFEIVAGLSDKIEGAAERKVETERRTGVVEPGTQQRRGSLEQSSKILSGLVSTLKGGKSGE